MSVYHGGSLQIDPLFPALRSDPTAVSGPPVKSKFLAINFSCRWSGILRPKIDGEHELSLRVAGKKRLTIDGKVVIDRWEGKGGGEESSVKIALEAGKHYKILVETSHPSGGGARFYWKKPGDEKRDVVKKSYLFTTEK